MSPTAIPNIAPWLQVSDAQRAVDFYTAAFGAVEVYRLDGDTEPIAVAQLSIGGAMFWLQHDADANSHGRDARAVRMILSVDDPDAVFARAVAAGAAIVASMHEDYGWRTGRITDPFGHDWEVSKQLVSS
jgi:PhnB protein